MSAVVGQQEVLTPILLRSTTPGPNEKVMRYLESMEGQEVDSTPPRSIMDPAEYRSTSGMRFPPYSPRSLANGGENDINGDDIDSNFQEESTSVIGADRITREPGPHDPPGPKYESYDSGPSFGNFGPLPADDPPASTPYGNSSWNPNWTNIMNTTANTTALTDGGQAAYPARATPSVAAKVPLPASVYVGSPRAPSTIAARIPLPASDYATSPRAPSIAIDPTATPRLRSQLGSLASPKPSERTMTPKSPSKSTRGIEDDRPLSPMSVRSKATNKTRATEKGTAYPPLPESRYGDGETNFDIGSPRSRARSKAPSISPSDSPSNIKPSPRPASNGTPRSPPLGSSISGGHQSRPFSPYRHAPTTADLMHAAARNRAMVIPEVDEKASSVRSKQPSVAPSQISKAPSQINKAPSQISKAPSQISKAPSQNNGNQITKTVSQVSAKQQSVASSVKSQDRAQTPSQDGLDAQEAQIVADALAGRTPRTSYYAETLEPEITEAFHDHELCVLLHQEADENLHEFVKKALRKAVRQRVKRLGMRYDAETIKHYRKSFHENDNVNLLNAQLDSDEPPKWASDLKREILLMQQRLESIGENLRPQDHSFQGSRFAYEGDEYTQTPRTQTVPIETQPTGTMADSMYQHAEDHFDDNATETARPPQTEETSRFRSYGTHDFDRDNSPGSIVLHEELYKLRQKPASQSGRSHNTWEVTRGEDGEEMYDDEEEEGGHAPSGLPTIPDTNGDAYEQDRTPSPPLPPLPPLPQEHDEHDEHEQDEQDMAVGQHNGDYSMDQQEYQLSPWQKVHQRLLNWTMIWPASEFDKALNSTTRGNQIDEVALTIWSTQTYKRYVRARLTESHNGVVDRLFVPPSVADAISNAVFHGRHGDACGMLKDLWTPFGMEGMPRLLIVLATHRSDPNHWVVHRFSLPDGNLTTYDTYRERTLPDGRPLGWWFAIRVAWPNAAYPDPDNLVQKMVRLHRPMQLPIDNSVAAAGIWRNLLMGSRAERSLDLERLRDLINTEVRNLRQRKQMGKLSIGAPKPNWEEMSKPHPEY